MGEHQPVVALRSSDGELIDQVRSVTEVVAGQLVVCPPGSAPPEADLLLDSVEEVCAEDEVWAPGPKALWVTPSGGSVRDETLALHLPDGAEDLLTRIRQAAVRQQAQVVGVLGARGGVGASVLAAVLARASAAEQARTALVDLDADSAGLDLLLGMEKEPGLRWSDLGEDRGHFAAAELTEALPAWHSVRVLSADWRGGAGPSTARHVVDALAAGVDVVVLDISRRQDWAAWAGRCAVVVLVAGCDVISAAGVQAVQRALGHADMRLVVRGPAPGGLSAKELAAACELPLTLQMRPERSLPAAIERGVAPGDQSSGPLMRAGRELVNTLGLAG